MAIFVCASAAACEEPAQAPLTTAPSVCPSCGPRAGGESSDFGGSVTGCGAVATRAPIEHAAAEALGYDVAKMRARVERDFDAPLSWELRELEEGEPPQGYEPETRVRGDVAMSTALQHYRPDPELCDGTTCVLEETTVEQATCPHFLSVSITVTLETLDGALMAVAEGEAVQWASGFEAMIGQGTDEHPIGGAYADLREVTGSLQLFPPEISDWRSVSEDEDAGLVTQPGHPYVGTLSISLSFEDDALSGWLQPSIAWEVIDENGDSELRSYEPLSATWGSTPSD